MSVFVYFDRNVYDLIYRKIKSNEHELALDSLEILKSSIASGQIAILLSHSDIQETIALFNFDLNKAKDQIRLMFSLVDNSRIIKPQKVLISDDIKSFAKSGVSSSSFGNKDYFEKLLFLQNPDQEDIGIIQRTNADTIKMKDDFTRFMAHVQDVIKYELEKCKGQKKPNFIDFFNHCSPLLAEDLAKHEGVLDECKKRGINNLLNIRSVRLSIGYNLSLLFSQWFEGYSQEKGDYLDQIHAMASSAARIFVSHDRKFRTRLSRIQINNYDVIDYDEFISIIKKGAILGY